MRFLYCLFIILQIVASADIDNNVTLFDTINCLKIEGVLNNYEKLGTKAANKGLSYKVFGITSYCYVYVGWIHELTNGVVHEDSTHYIDTSNTACKNKQVMQVLLEGIDERILLVVDRFGRRVRVQSAVSGAVVKSSGFIWIKLPFNDRRQQFYSKPIQLGYVIQSFVNINYRVYLVTIGHQGVKLMELRVFSDGKNLRPYVIHLKSKDNGNIEIDTKLVTPHIGLFARAVHDIELGYKGQTTTRPGIGLAFSHRLDLHEPLAGVIPAVPVESLMRNTYYYYRASYLNSRFLYRRGNDFNLVVRLPQPGVEPGQTCLGWVNYLMLYEYNVKGKSGKDDDNASKYNLSGGENALTGILKNVFLNQHNMHSRMAYPHITRTRTDRNIMSTGWKDLKPVILGTIATMAALTALYVLVRSVKNRNKKHDVTTSLTKKSW